nr:MAG TPA: hypothetical protein [Bacteriophage sp.]
MKKLNIGCLGVTLLALIIWTFFFYISWRILC